jgi:hypothetical protein
MNEFVIRNGKLIELKMESWCCGKGTTLKAATENFFHNERQNEKPIDPPLVRHPRWF